MLIRVAELIADLAVFSGIVLIVIRGHDVNQAVKQIGLGLVAFWLGVAFIAFQ